MGFFTWIQKKLGQSVPLSGTALNYILDEYAGMVGDLYIREMAFWSAVLVISRAISKCEFKTIFEGKETKAREYYLWNIEPNKNQNSSQFLHEIIAKMLRKNECLVIEHNGQYLIADSFMKKQYVLYDDVFEQVTVKDFTFSKKFKQQEVLYFRLASENMCEVVNRLYVSYSKLLAYSMTAYQRSRGTKGIFKYEALPIAGTPEREQFDKLTNERMSAWLSGDSAALPLGRGQDWKELQHKTYSNESTRDIRALVDDISDFTAKAFGIPPALLRGDIAGIESAMDEFLTFCIDPLADLLSEEINRKIYGYAGFRSGSYLKIDTTTIKHFDWFANSSGVDKLISSGAKSVNEVRVLAGDMTIDEPWADAHFMTKNYIGLQGDGFASMGGGEKK